MSTDRLSVTINYIRRRERSPAEIATTGGLQCGYRQRHTYLRLLIHDRDKTRQDAMYGPDTIHPSFF